MAGTLILDRIRRLFDENKLIKADFADKTQIARGTLDNWLKGKTHPNQQDIEKMTKILDEMEPEMYKNLDDNKIIKGEVFRKIVEGETEYVLIARSVLQEKYRLVAIEQYDKDKEQIEKDKKTIAWLQETVDKLIAKLDGLDPQPAHVQKSQ